MAVGLILFLFVAVLLGRAHRRSRKSQLRWGRKMSASFIASPEFLQTSDWKRARYMALRANDGRCELCGRNKHQLPRGEYLCADHVKPRAKYPELALDLHNIQIICTAENLGKGNIDETDWRHPSHPHRR